MKLIIFDCDDTIWKIPYKENDTYMDLPESITSHEFEYNTNILKIYKKKKKDKDVKFVILTNRTVLIKDVILNKLECEKNLIFDFVMFRVDNRDKSLRLKNLIRTINNIDYIEFYDDKEKHINSINKLKKKFPNIIINTFKV